MNDLRRYPLGAIVMVAMLAGCNAGSHASQQGQATSPPTASEAAPSTVASPVPWPSYLAKDYEEHGHPALTRSQMSMIRFALAQVKPCQRAFLRYAFPRNGGNLPFVLFFQGPSYEWPHVFWTNNGFYKPIEGEEFPGSPGDEPPKWNGIKWDIDHARCVPGSNVAFPDP